MKRCNSCENILADSANFCNNCGCSDFTPIAEDLPAMEPAAADPATYYADGGVPVGSAPGKKLSAGMVIGLCGIAAILIAVTVLLALLANPVRRLMNRVEKCDYAGAAQIFGTSIADNPRRLEKAETELEAYSRQQLARYLSGEISYEELSSRLQTIICVGVSGESASEALSQASFVYECQETFAAAEEAAAIGDYAAAVTLYAKVAGADFDCGVVAESRLAEVSVLYREEVLTAVRQHIDSHEYPAANALLSEAFEILPNDDALMAVREECARAEYDYSISCVIEEARIYCDSDDFAGAVALLEEQLSLYPDELRLQEEREACLTRFEAYVISESYRLASAGDYSGAAALTASGLSCFESEKAALLHRIYLSHIPVNLGDMEILPNNSEEQSGSETVAAADKYLEEKYGASYSHSFSVGCGSVTYQLDRGYLTFSGTVAFPAELTAGDGRVSATLTIRGDGEEIAVFRDVTDTTRPEEFSLEVADFEQITLTWELQGDDAGQDWGDFATIFDGLLIPVPLRLPETID